MLDRDTKFAQFKIAFLQYVTVAIFFGLSTGFWRLQISQPDYYRELADQNRIKNLPLLAPRGRITDRDGRTIAGNYPSFSILFLREQFKNADAVIPAIAAGLDLNTDELRARIRHFRSAPKYEPVIIKEDATLADLAFIEAHRDELPGLEHVVVSRRLYPRDGFLAHLLGYVGEVSETELDLPEFASFRTGQMVGKTGIERQYNDILMGQDGLRQVVVNNRGRVVGHLDETPSKAGTPLKLTIDLDLQAAAEEAMEGKNGAAIAIDPRSGEVLALVSRPTFDPNKFAVRITRNDWKDLTEDPHHPLMDKAIQAQLAPGSTFKIIETVAALDSDAITTDTAFNCSGAGTFYGRVFKCHTKGGHGHVQLHQAIVQSCDVFFYNVGIKLGIDKLAYYATHLGLGVKTGIDLPSEEAGVMPSTAWKLRNFHEKWYAGEVVSVAIGQGNVQATPIQLAYALGGIASGGYFHRPHVVFPDEVRKELDIDHTTYFPIAESTVDAATSGMWGVVNEAGTAVRARLVGIDIGGKTGTAQVASNDLVKAKKGTHDMDLRDNAWFVGVSPHRNPEIAVTALLEHGETSANAVPIAREIIRAYSGKEAPPAPSRSGADRDEANYMTRNVTFKDFDWTLLALVLVIAGLGVMEIYSTTHNTRKFDGSHVKQIYWIIIAMAAMFFVSLIDYHALMNRWFFLYTPIILALMGLLAFGGAVFGSKRWIPLGGGTQIQVSEFVKLVIILALARYFSESRTEQVTLTDLAKVGCLVGLPIVLIMLQPDLGTALTIVPAAAVAIFLAGLRAKYLVVLLLVAAVAAPIGWFVVLQPYQKNRVATFLNPSLDPQKRGYQQLQSKIAVGSGGLWGKGTAKGSQTQLSFLPVPHTDFIFAAFAEEHGFFGVLSVLLLYFMVLMRLIHNAQTAPDRAGMFVVMGVTAILLFQVLVNVGMVVGYMPVVGIPLPLMSKGGSSILFTFMALGLVNNVRLRRFVN